MIASVVSRARRFVDWFWVPSEGPAAPPLSLEARGLVRAVRALILLGEHALGREVGDETLDAGVAHLAAIANFREALRLGLPVVGGAGSNPDAWFEAREGGARAFAEAVSDLATARRIFVEASLATLASQDESALERDALFARDFVRRVLGDLVAREASRRERLRTRVTRLGLLALGVVALALLAPGARRALKTDLGPSAAWRASTTMGPLPQTGRGFHPREGEGNFFFQTQVEPEPWLELDLGAGRTIEAVTVQNRLDCCQEWAVPLVIEVADAARRWREVGRRVEPFYFYTAVFAPTPARYVRLRVPRMTSLHLGGVQVR